MILQDWQPWPRKDPEATSYSHLQSTVTYNKNKYFWAIASSGKNE